MVKSRDYVQGLNYEIKDDYVFSPARARLPGPAVACMAINGALGKIQLAGVVGFLLERFY